MKQDNKKAYIAGVAGYVPENVLDNTDLEFQFPDWSVDKIFSKTGINRRHIADNDETCSDMAVRASENLFEKFNIDRSNIDFVLLCTQSPDYFLPTTACLVQDRLGLSINCGALDFNLGCSGYVYGLSLAKGLVETSQADNVLLITSEMYSKYLSEKDKSVRTLFGDGATATLISSCVSNNEMIGPFVYGTDGSGFKNLIVSHGGRKHPINKSSDITTEPDYIRSPKNLYMNGANVLTFTMKTVPKSIIKLLKKANLEVDSIDYFVFHQANKLILDMLKNKVKIDDDAFLTSYETFGNTVSSTIPLGIEKAAHENRFKDGDKIMLIGFGVGYSWAGTLVTWKSK